MKKLAYSTLMLFFILYISCKGEEPEPEYIPKKPIFDFPFYNTSFFDVRTNINVSFTGGIGEAIQTKYRGGFFCDSNSFGIDIKLDKNPNMQYNIYPQISKVASTTQIPFKVGKLKIEPKIYGDVRDCRNHMTPEGQLSWVFIENKGLSESIITRYLLDNKEDNYIEIIKMDTLNHDIKGNFKMTFIREGRLLGGKPSTLAEYPDTVKVMCSRFNIEWGKK